MKRIFFAVALAVVAADARADWGCSGAIPPQAAGAKVAGGGGGEGAYGVNPMLKRLCWWKKDAGCSTCGGGGHAGHGGNGGAGAGAGGTLVFPQHQFARSPRDWFMYGN
jgi:hypothetical protein